MTSLASKLITPLAAMALVAAAPALAQNKVMTQADCALDKRKSIAAADSAVSRSTSTKPIQNGVIVGAGCAGLLWVAAVDGGFSALICTLAGAATVLGSSEQAQANSGDTWTREYKRVRNQQCIIRYGN